MTANGRNASSSSSEGGSRSLSTWLLLLGIPLLMLASAFALGWGSRGTGADLEQMQARLAALEEALAQSGASDERPPAFRPGLAQAPGGSAAAPEGLAALQARVEKLEGQIEAVVLDPIARTYAYAEASSAELRRMGIRTLRRMAADDPKARALLRKLLHDPDPGVRREALEAFERVPDSAALTDVTALLGDDDGRVRQQAIETLVDMTEGNKDLAGKQLAESSIRGLLGDPDPDIRRRAADALGDLESKQAVGALTALLKDADPRVQSEAIQALERIGDKSALGDLQGAYGDGSGENALEAAVALNRLGDSRAFREQAGRLAKQAQSASGDRERRQAIRLLAENDPGTHRDLFQRALSDPSERVRREARRALERAGNKP